MSRIASYKQSQKYNIQAAKNKQRQTDEKANNHTKGGLTQKPQRGQDINGSQLAKMKKSIPHMSLP